MTRPGGVDPIEVVCVGAGWATRERHLPSLLADSRVCVLGVVDKHAERAQDVARRFQLPHWGTSLNEPWLDRAQCLTVGVPPLEHTGVVGSALDHGWHCLCEKPFVFPATRAAGYVDQAKAAGLVLAVVHNFQFSRAGRRLFDLVDQDMLGPVRAVYGFQLSNPRRRLPHWHRALPGGLFLDEAPHLLYLIRRLLGRLEPRTADASLEGTEIRHLVATFSHDSIWASLSMSFDASVSEWQLVVVGERATASFDIFRDILVVLRNDGRHRAHEILRTSAALVSQHVLGTATSGSRHVRRKLLYGNDETIKRFVDAVEGRPARISGMAAEDGLAVVACLEQLLEMIGLGDAWAAAPT